MEGNYLIDADDGRNPFSPRFRGNTDPEMRDCKECNGQGKIPYCRNCREPMPLDQLYCGHCKDIECHEPCGRCNDGKVIND